MTTELLNEAERFLLKNWGDARLLEESMEKVRTKYREVFERVINAVREAHPELNASTSFPTQFWSKGSIGFGRKSWPGGNSKWPAGFWIWDVRLEVLVAQDTEPPCASIWIDKKHDLNFDQARAAITSAAKRLFTPDEQKELLNAESGDHLIWFTAPSKGELLDSLAEGDGQGFVALMVSQLDKMARFIPELDRLFQECNQVA